MKKYIITEEIVNGLLTYMQERPFKEVANGITMLSNLPVYEEEKINNDIK